MIRAKRSVFILMALAISACINTDSPTPGDGATRAFADYGSKGRVKEVERYPAIRRHDRHRAARAAGVIETLTRFTFDGTQWAISIYRSRGEGVCVDFNGVEPPERPPYNLACSESFRKRTRTDHVGGSFASAPNRQEQRVILGEVSPQVAALRVQCRDGLHDVTILKPTKVATSSGFYAFVAVEHECSHRVALDDDGEVIEREHLYDNSVR